MSETAYLRNNFTKLEKAKETPQNKVPKIQKVASYLRDREHSKNHYLPRLVSIGPIDHGKRKLELGEKYKLMWTAKYLQRTKQDGPTLYQKIASNIKHLKEQFAEDVIRDFDGDDEKLSWTLFVDGCSLLQILEKANLEDRKEMNLKVDQLVLVCQDVLLLENQLPYEVLKLLSGHQNDDTLVNSMNKFLEFHHLPAAKDQCIGKYNNKEGDRALDEDGYASVYVNEETLDERKDLPFHLLDKFHRRVVGDSQHQNQDLTMMSTKRCFDTTTYRNIKELREAGIKLRLGKSRRLRDIVFSYRSNFLWAELILPEITVDDTTATTFHNLIAYEMCPDFENNFEISSFVAFMDSLIDHHEDVKELRLAKVLHNSLGSDEEVSQLFNTISADLVPNCAIYSGVRRQIENHYKKKYRAWIALGYHTYFSNPWAFIGFLAAIFALVLTFIQAWFAIHPKC
ncbi:uncharacterized protein LOC106766127 [Vigna radiata var. radiata]|uniref:Uncharacterized protein LOC106766127 n=1 Tax=Vigna radiata var. radiata TaxID=3916 RepID=A0A1S3UKA7_VIGRR|nr:uncharacterized protein LOC106766127 [Vigna radiata var. radiata]